MRSISIAAACALKDAAECGVDLSPVDAAALQRAAAGDRSADHAAIKALGDFLDRNPRTDLYCARDEAKRLRRDVAGDPTLLSAEDHTLLRRVSRTTDITSQQISGVKW